MKFLLVICLLFPFYSWSQEQDKVVKKCLECDFIENRDMAKFCIHCGKPLSQVTIKMVLMCEHCNCPIDKSGQFCAFCGKKGKWVEKAVLKNREKNPTPEASENSSEASENSSDAGENSSDASENSSEEYEVVPYPNSTLLEKISQDALQKNTERQIFVCSDPLEQIEKFYKSQYPSLSVIRDSSYHGIHVLKLKFATSEQQININYYKIVDSKSAAVWDATKKRIHLEYAKKIESIPKLKQKIKELEKKIQDKQASQNTEKELQKVQEQYNLMIHSASYWDILMMEKVASRNKSLLLISISLQN